MTGRGGVVARVRILISDALQRKYELVRSIEIMRKRGLVNPLRLDEDLRALRVARRAGPFAVMILHATRHAPEVPAIVDERGMLTFEEVEDRANALASGLAEVGIRPGSVTGVLCRNHRGMVLALIALGKLGARLVLLNTGLAKPQLEHLVERESVTAMLLDSEFVTLAGMLPRAVPRVLTWEDGGHVDPTIPTLDHLMAGRSTSPPPLPAEPGGMVLLTSGTTGTPKGAPRDWSSPFQSAQLLDRVPLSRRGAEVIATPLFHSTGLGHFIMAMSLGKTVVFPNRTFDAEKTLAGIADVRADTLVVVPTMLQRMVDLGPDVLAKYDTSSLKIIASGGSAISPDLCRRTAEIFGNVLYNSYGSTEVASATIATPPELQKAPGTVGRPPVGCRVAIYDKERNRVTQPNMSGTIFVSNGISSPSYTDGSQKEVVDGMVSTGDVGYFDDEGLFFVDGREDDMIVSGGENVFPLEVENLLASRPDIYDAAVVGVDDPDFGQRLRAFVVPGPHASADAQEVKEFIKANLARYKVPRDVIFVDAIPRNAAGKLLRQQLEQLVQ